MSLHALPPLKSLLFIASGNLAESFKLFEQSNGWSGKIIEKYQPSEGSWTGQHLGTIYEGNTSRVRTGPVLNISSIALAKRIGRKLLSDQSSRKVTEENQLIIGHYL